MDALKEEYETEKRLYELEKEENTPTDEELEEKDAKNKEVDSLKQFGQDARNGFKVNKATMVEGHRRTVVIRYRRTFRHVSTHGENPKRLCSIWYV